jgi:DNA-binding NarL/FixJ family response regulator
MLGKLGKLLIVDEDVSVRTSLSLVFSALGYCVRSSEDGRSGYSELIKDVPDILLSDLNMVRMSSLEFFLTVRRRFPSIRVIAMGKNLSSHRVPHGVAADALYQKGAGPVRLIKTVEAMMQTKGLAVRPSMDNLFGFRVFEAIPPHPTAEGMPFPANPTLMPTIPENESEGDNLPTPEQDWAPDFGS